MERTLLIIKPDAVAQNVIGEIIRRLEESDFRVAELKKVYLTPERAAEFYAVHKERPFYNDLLDFMTSGPCVPKWESRFGKTIRFSRRLCTVQSR